MARINQDIQAQTALDLESNLNVVKAQPSLRRRLTSGFFWVLVAALATQAGGFLEAIIPARLLGIENYGKLAAIQSTLTMLASFAGLGIGTTAARYVAQLRQTDPTRAGRVIGLCILIVLGTAGIFTTGLILFAPFFSQLVLGSSELANELRLGAIFLFFFTLTTCQIGILSGFEAFSRLAWAACLQTIGTVAMVLVFTLMWGLPGTILALGGGALLTWLLQEKALRREYRRWMIRVRFAEAGKEKHIFAGFALPAALSGILGGVVTAGGNAILVRQVNGLTDVAIFYAANTIRTIALFAPSLLTRVTMPILSNLYGLKRQASFRKTFALTLLVSTGFAIFSALGIFILSPILLNLFGKSFLSGDSVLALSLTSAIFEVVAVNLFQVLYSHGRIWTHLFIVSIWSALILSITWKLAPEWGADGLALSYCVGWLVSCVFYGIVVQRLLRQDQYMASAIAGAA
jgi:O-antigen/teichoic acid export membrane protein